MNPEYRQLDCREFIGTIPIYGPSVKERRSNTIRMFDLFSPFYDAVVSSISRLRVGRSYRERVRREVIAQLDFNPEHRLLDVGIGTGIHLLFLQPRPRSVVGVDPSIGMLRRCARRLLKHGIHGELFCHSAEELRFADDEFDRIMCCNVLMYVPSYRHVIKEMLRVLKPTGKLVIIVDSSWLSRQDNSLFLQMDREFLVTTTKPKPEILTLMTVQQRK